MENNQFIAQQINQLPQKAKEELQLFMEFLFSKYDVNSKQEVKSESEQESKKRTGFGSWKGIQLSDDFDEPLEDFKDYMPE